MMTEFAFSVAEKVIEKIGSLGSLAYQEICLAAGGISSDLKRLELTMSTIQSHVFYDAVDVLDEFECEALRRQVVKTHGSAPGQKREMTHSFVRDSDVIGRDDDKEKIIDLLMHPGDDGTVPVISIVGIGGLGKTTLAQWVYNDERVAKNFASRIWVCVSEEFTVLKLAKEILKSVGGEISENMSMDKVQASLRSYLKEKRFFIVLDDVWNEDRNKWIGLKKLLIEGAKGSKIVVTTRSHKVAKVMAPGPIHDLIGLPEDDCLFLFLKWAFVEGEEKQYPKLVEIGKQIVKKCSGVPLAVRTLGSLLYSKTEERDWISIRDNEIWNLEQKEDDILPALRLRNTHIKKLPNSICDLQNLESLILYGYDELEELPRDIRDRRKIFSIKLILYGCDELEELPRDIRKMCPGLESFPEGIQRLTALRSSYGFMDCENLAALPEWLPNLTSLQKLQIWGVPKIIVSARGNGLPHCPKRTGRLIDCGELSKNCEREVGVEWPKIKHIPQIDIKSD
uniref:NB-ARC domain-containing protein n=1 Tax=Fagus sylvatica TaxID=28930 RepID=A0A2N9FIT1_FAGSY